MANKKNPYSIREIFHEMELELIASLKKAFYSHKEKEGKEGFQWEQWQLAKLRNLEKYRKKNKSIIGKYNDTIEKTINKTLQDNFNRGETRVARVAKSAINILMPSDKTLKGSYREENFFGVNEKKLDALQVSIKNDIQNAKVSTLRLMDDIYKQTIFKTQFKMQSGAKTLYKAIDEATANFIESGINSITYKDGRRVNISSYAEMALRTASQRATFLGEGKKRDEWGMHLVVVSAHANTCEKCAPWQGKILIDDVFSHGTKADGDYPLLSDAIKAGLLHPNCRHTLITYFPGVTQIPQVIDTEEALSTYDLEQKQRYMERQVRKWKRRQQGSLDADNVLESKSKLLEWKGKLSKLLKDNPQLRRNYEREKIETGISDNGNIIQTEEFKITKKEINNAYSVNRELVNSKEYHDKFERVPLNKSVRENLYIECKKILEHRDGTELEDLIILDSRVGQKITQNIDSKDKLKTGLNQEQYEKVRSHNGNIILLHNHPGGGRLSGTDIITMHRQKNIEMSVVAAHDGKIHYVYDMKREIDIEKIYNEEYTEFKKYYDDIIAKKKATDVLYMLNVFKYVVE